jgi:hypothetical protein
MPRGSGAPTDEDEHDGLVARGGDETRTGEDVALCSSEDNEEEAGVTRTTPRGGDALASEDGEEGGGRRLKGGEE